MTSWAATCTYLKPVLELGDVDEDVEALGVELKLAALGLARALLGHHALVVRLVLALSRRAGRGLGATTRTTILCRHTHAPAASHASIIGHARLNVFF